jgi:dTDP-4-amino-4,6-dideoxygalactose transaminase
MYRDGVVCGIHYKPAHLNKLYGDIFYPTINYSCDNEPYTQSLPNSEKDGREVVSIPFHEKLTDKEIDKIIKLCIQHTTL